MDTLIGVPAPVKSARRTTRQLYKPLDIQAAKVATWPAAIPLLEADEAVKAARRLLQRFYVRRWDEEGRRGLPYLYPVRKSKGGVRYTWFRRGELVVVWSRGWRHLVHDLSHAFHSRLRPGDKPHSDSHRHLEKEMIAYVVNAGWLDGKLKKG